MNELLDRNFWIGLFALGGESSTVERLVLRQTFLAAPLLQASIQNFVLLLNVAITKPPFIRMDATSKHRWDFSDSVCHGWAR